MQNDQTRVVKPIVFLMLVLSITACGEEEKVERHDCMVETFGGDGDSRISRVELYRDGEGRVLIRKGFGATDEDALYIWSYVYEGGNLIRYESDSDLDGQADRVCTYEHGLEGRLVSESCDNEPDGQADYRYTYEYDSEGRLVSESRDNEPDGVNDSQNRFYYDEDARQIIEEEDHGIDGVIEVRITETYDEAGRIVDYTRDGDGFGRLPDGHAEWQETYEYDGEGRLIRTHISPDHLGGPVVRIDLIYRGDLLIREEQFSYSGGIVEWKKYFYDSHGRLERLESRGMRSQPRDVSLDDPPSWVTYYTYDCPWSP